MANNKQPCTHLQSAVKTLVWSRDDLTIYLRPGTEVTGEPSLSTHDTNGMGIPCAEHVTAAPLSLLNSSFVTGSCTKTGACVPISNMVANNLSVKAILNLFLFLIVI